MTSHFALPWSVSWASVQFVVCQGSSWWSSFPTCPCCALQISPCFIAVDQLHEGCSVFQLHLTNFIKGVPLQLVGAVMQSNDTRRYHSAALLPQGTLIEFRVDGHFRPCLNNISGMVCHSQKSLSTGSLSHWWSHLSRWWDKSVNHCRSRMLCWVSLGLGVDSICHFHS